MWDRRDVAWGALGGWLIGIATSRLPFWIDRPEWWIPMLFGAITVAIAMRPRRRVS